MPARNGAETAQDNLVNITPEQRKKAEKEFGKEVDGWSPIVQELAVLIVTQDGWLDTFKQGFQKAYKEGKEDMTRYGITSLNKWLNFINYDLAVWIPMENKTANNVYYHLCLFYWVLNADPIGSLQTPIVPESAGKEQTTLDKWMVKFAKSVGSHLSDLKVTNEIVESFRDAYSLSYYQEPKGGWTSLNFNEFFARDINRLYRPVAAPEDDTVITSPADSVFDGHWPISDISTVQFDNHGRKINVKGVDWSINELLDTDSERLQEAGFPHLKDLFAGGTFIHSFLGPNDFHRQWAPIRGKVVYAPKTQYQGLVYLQVNVVKEADGTKHLRPIRKLNPKPKKSTNIDGHGFYDLEAPDEPGYQFLQTRGLILIENETVGYIAVLPIGMAQVSSVVIHPDIVTEGKQTKHTTVEKGQEISNFFFGGSDCIVLFQANRGIEITAQVSKQYLAGQQIARVVKK